MASGDLDVAQRDSRIEGRHDECGPEHVGVDDPEPGPLADRADPPVSGPAVEALTVLPPQDGSLGAFPDHEVEGPGRLGTNGTTAGLLPLPRTRNVR